MKNEFGAVECFLQNVLVGDAAFNEIYIAADLFDVLAMSGREIVKHSDARAARAQRGSNV